MRTMVEAVKQHRLRREREEAAKAGWLARSPEPLAFRAGMRSPPRTLASVETMVNVGGDGNAFALFIAALMHALGASVRINLGCANNASLTHTPNAAQAAQASQAAQSSRASQGIEAATPTIDAAVSSERGTVCQLFTEVRMGKHANKLVSWVRAYLPASKWLGTTYHYRVDISGYIWLNLDWLDSQRVQRPGAPYKPFSTLSTFHPSTSRWEKEGGEFDSAGEPKLRRTPVHTLAIGVR
eukprot:5903865-Pleurochrysis_carterae.AAC.2